KALHLVGGIEIGNQRKRHKMRSLCGREFSLKGELSTALQITKSILNFCEHIQSKRLADMFADKIILKPIAVDAVTELKFKIHRNIRQRCRQDVGDDFELLFVLAQFQFSIFFLALSSYKFKSTANR